MCRVRVCERSDGWWTVYLITLPWNSPAAENTFASAQQAYEAADGLYQAGLTRGRWKVRHKA